MLPTCSCRRRAARSPPAAAGAAAVLVRDWGVCDSMPRRRAPCAHREAPVGRRDGRAPLRRAWRSVVGGTGLLGVVGEGHQPEAQARRAACRRARGPPRWRPRAGLGSTLVARIEPEDVGDHHHRGLRAGAPRRCAAAAPGQPPARRAPPAAGRAGGAGASPGARWRGRQQRRVAEARGVVAAAALHDRRSARPRAAAAPGRSGGLAEAHAARPPRPRIRISERRRCPASAAPSRPRSRGSAGARHPRAAAPRYLLALGRSRLREALAPPRGGWC